MVEVASIPPLDFVLGFPPLLESGLVGVAWHGALFLLPKDVSLHWGLSSVVRYCSVSQGRPLDSRVWLDPLGAILRGLSELRHFCSLHLADDLTPLPIPHVDPEDLVHVCAVRASGPLTYEVPQALLHRVDSALPPEVFQALGWSIRTCTAGSRAQILFAPQSHGPQLPERQLLPLVGTLFFKGCLQYLHRRSTGDPSRVLVLVQVVGRKIWSGTLPGHVSYQDLLDVWHSCYQIALAPRRARVYSGPYSVPVETCLSQAAKDASFQVSFTRQGHLRVTLLPEVRGGGAKETKYSQPQTALAQCLLDHGLTLTETTALTDRLMPRAGLPRVSQLLQMSSAQQRWQEIRAMCEKFGLPLPAPGEPLLCRRRPNVVRRRPRYPPPETLSCSPPSFARRRAVRCRCCRSSFQDVLGLCCVTRLTHCSSRSPLQGRVQTLALAVLGSCPSPSDCKGREKLATYKCEHDGSVKFDLLSRCCVPASLLECWRTRLHPRLSAPRCSSTPAPLMCRWRPF